MSRAKRSIPAPPPKISKERARSTAAKQRSEKSQGPRPGAARRRSETVRESSPGAARRRSPEAVRESSPKPTRRGSPKPARESSPEPAPPGSSEPARESSPEPTPPGSPEPGPNLTLATSTAHKPQNIDEYKQWAQEWLGVDFADRLIESRHAANAAVIDDIVQASQWYQKSEEKLAALNNEYKTASGETLFMGQPSLILHKKPYTSMIDKSFRMNVVDNTNYPEAPENGWVVPDNWFGRMNDTIRTTLVCRFLDAPDYTCQAIQQHAFECGLSAHYAPRGRDEGYYSHHLYITFWANILTTDSSVEQSVDLEIQVTTQLQDILKNLTHRYYSQDRSAPSNKNWKWEFRTNRFRARFLSHSLHLLEALIVDVRDNKS